MVSRVLFWAVAAAAVIMGATLVEDALTGGAGLADDVASLGLAGSAAAAIPGIQEDIQMGRKYASLHVRSADVDKERLLQT